MKHVEGLRKEGSKFSLSIYTCCDEDYKPVLATEWSTVAAVTSGDYYTPTQKWKEESNEESWAFCAGGVGCVTDMTMSLLVKDRLHGTLMWQSYSLISNKV